MASSQPLDAKTDHPELVGGPEVEGGPEVVGGPEAPEAAEGAEASEVAGGRKGRKMEKLLVMLHPGRSGSTVLGSMLRQHPSIRWKREIFTRLERNPIPYDAEGTILWRDYIESMVTRCKRPVLGIEIKLQQIWKQQLFGEDLTAALRALSGAFDFDLILLTRRNHLERWLSSEVARETKRFQYREGEEAPKVALPLPENLRDLGYGLKAMAVNDWLDRVEALDAELRRAVDARGGLILSYEDDILDDPSRAYRRILEFAGLPETESEPLYIKADRRPLHERLSNFDDLAGLLRPEHYRRYCTT